MPNESFRLMVTHDGRRTVVKPIGRLEGMIKESLAQCLEALALAGEGEVIVDLAGLEPGVAVGPTPRRRREKAMSVAIGILQPRLPAVPALGTR